MSIAGSTLMSAQLWQMPLLLLAIGLFAYSAYLFIDPKPGLSVEQRVETARVYLVHGRWDAPPWDLSRAVLIRTRYLARRLNNKDDMPERASSVATEGGTITFAFPTLPRPTGLPEVDIVYMRYALASQLPVKV